MILKPANAEFLLPWLVLSVATASVGAVIPVAAWWQSSALLTAAGSPDGLTPTLSFGWGWIVGGIALAMAHRPWRQGFAVQARDEQMALQSR